MEFNISSFARYGRQDHAQVTEMPSVLDNFYQPQVPVEDVLNSKTKLGICFNIHSRLFYATSSVHVLVAALNIFFLFSIDTKYILKISISGRTQLLFTIVFTLRYLDLFTTFISWYNSAMKIMFLVSSYGTLYLIYIKFKVTYDRSHDTFRIEFLLIPTAILALIVNHSFTVVEIFWAFSIYLEAVAILPQLFMITRTGEAESITSHYLFALGSYRALYILNWIYRYFAEDYYDLIAIIAGIVQTILYCDFFYLYITKVLRGRRLALPA